MHSTLERTLRDDLGIEMVDSRALGGGDINEAFRVDTADGQRLFVKANASSPAGMFEAEAKGLTWLAEGGTLRVPRVIAHSEAAYPVLVMEYLEPGAPAADHDERLGRGLAALHRHGAERFGLGHHNFIGTLPQDNTFHDEWVEFFRARRLEPQLRLAVDSGRASSGMRRGFERLFQSLDELVGPREPPARLHGDLWGGNLHTHATGEPCLIDPAAYAGHREIDLAMMRLFGGFGPRVFEAYHATHPLAPGHEQRIELYQLYPLMVHVNLFGGGYAGSVERILRRLA